MSKKAHESSLLIRERGKAKDKRLRQGLSLFFVYEGAPIVVLVHRYASVLVAVQMSIP